MRIIAVTGRKAENLLREEIEKWREERREHAHGQSEKDECEVCIITQDIGIAAFTTPETLLSALKKKFLHTANTANAASTASTARNSEDAVDWGAAAGREEKKERDEREEKAGSACIKRLRDCLADYDLILVSGLCKSDFSDLEREIGVPIRLGPRDARDIGEVLTHAFEIEFSKSVPADEFLIKKRRENALEKLKALESAARACFSVKGVKIGGNSRMKICAEIVDATLLSEDEIKRIMSYFIESGADMIDIGVHVGASSDDVVRAVRAALSCDSSVPISVDSVDAELLIAGIYAGADIVLSLNSGNIEKVGEEVANAGIAAVVIPDACADSENKAGNSADAWDDAREDTRDEAWDGAKDCDVHCGINCGIYERNVRSLMRNLRHAREMGIKNLIADPILNAPGYGLAESIHNYFVFRRYDRKTPLFFGVGNVTELIDADSVGVNAVLTAIASELNASVLFTPEHSDKCVGSVRELRTAAEMMMLAAGGPPKDLGIDLLVLKEKRRKRERWMEMRSTDMRSTGINASALSDEASSDVASAVIARESEGWRLDPFGCFRIEICETPFGRRIVAEHEPSGVKIVGRTAKEVLDTILRQGLVSLIEHAGYLGRELAKAEIALALKRSYRQDEPLFK